ncbi:MAG: hypothetical protein U0798_00980 [Gemmataceae bacterium]
MNSIVGHQCVICRHTILNTGEAIFCPGCGCPCHYTCGRPQGPEKVSQCCLTCGAPRPEIARYKNERELKLLNMLAQNNAAPYHPLEGRHKMGLAIGVTFVMLGLIRFGLYVGGVEVPKFSAVIFTLVPLGIGLVIFFMSLWHASRKGW